MEACLLLSLILYPHPFGSVQSDVGQRIARLIVGALERRWCPNSALLGFFGIWLGSNLSRQEKLVLLIGSHVPTHDFLEPKQDFFRTQGFFVVEGRSHYDRNLMTD